MEFTAEQQQQYQYQPQQQQQQQQPQAYQYDPSLYDPQSTAPYYAYPNQQQPLQQQQYQFYPHQDSYSQQYPQFYQETASIHPPGVPFDPSAHQPAVYYQPQPPVDPQQHHQVIPVSGYDPTAASSFAGNIDAAQRDYPPPPQIQPTYRGGRRGGRPFRGRGRGHGAPPRRGRHSGSKPFASVGTTSAIQNSVMDPNTAAVVMPPSALVPGQATLPSPVPAAPVQRPPRMAWCELCRVDCNTPEILEQHKNGKRHKKNLKSREDMQMRNTVITGQQSLQVPNIVSEVAQFKKGEGIEEKHQHEALSSTANTDDKKEFEQQKDITNKSEASPAGPAETNRKLKGPSEARGRGLKRKMRGGRGGKNIKSFEGSRRPVDPPKPAGGIPFICELCNVKCETQAVFDSHLAGKKHIANMRRFQGHRALYGEAGLQTLYPPNLSAPSPSFIPQIQQDLTDPQVVLAQLLNYVLSQAQVPGLAAPQISLPAATLAPSQMPLSSLEIQYPNEFPQGSFVTPEIRREEAAANAEASPFAGNIEADCQNSQSEKNVASQQQTFTASAGIAVKVDNGALVLENKPVISPMDNSICAMSDKPLMSSTSEKDVKTEPGSNNNLEKSEKDSKEDVLKEHTS